VKLKDKSATAELPDGSEVDAKVTVEDGALTISPQSYSGSVKIALPNVLRNVSYQTAEIKGESVEIELELGPTTLQRSLDE
jgi:hypothetical protein